LINGPPLEITLISPPRTASFNVVHHPSGSLRIINTTPSPQVTKTKPNTNATTIPRLGPLCCNAPDSASPPSLCPGPHLPHPTDQADSDPDLTVSALANPVPYTFCTSALVPNIFFRNSGVRIKL
jgi:hypothetical protein